MVREVRVSWDSDEELSGLSFRWGYRVAEIEDDWDDDGPITLPMRQTTMGNTEDSAKSPKPRVSRRRAKKSGRSTQSDDESSEHLPKRNLADANWLEWAATQPLKRPKHPGRVPNQETGLER
ncbi:hypothetical protein [Thalassoroseus pseudoceratinae]|uniref:hypothetical protein n=1 Tax=Thalassoroseus pseudoceratinae TaxID=2713176 RepID=UPI00141E8560|nr:hypothetical protein [Thalassoroseus pseudoceratinae]